MKYTVTHEWIQVSDEAEGTIGITERIQEMYSNIIFVELPPLRDFEQGEILGRIETADGKNFYIYAPVSGEVYEINTALEDDIQLLNRFPESDGWICKLYIENLSEFDSLLNLVEYYNYEEDEPCAEEYMPEVDFYENVDDY